MAASEEERRRVAQAKAEGMSNVRAAKAGGVTESAVRHWLKTDPEFSRTIATLNAQIRMQSAETLGVAHSKLLKKLNDDDDTSTAKDLSMIWANAAKQATAEMPEPVNAEARKQYASEDEALRDLAARLTPEQLAKLNEMSAG